MHNCQVWDRRCFVTERQAAGVLTGHLEGITFIDSHGDGRYFISNSKDQTIKLWDIRKMSSGTNWYVLVPIQLYFSFFTGRKFVDKMHSSVCWILDY